MDFRSSSGRYARSRHLAESHPQVLIIALVYHRAEAATHREGLGLGVPRLKHRLGHLFEPLVGELVEHSRYWGHPVGADGEDLLEGGSGVRVVRYCWGVGRHLAVGQTERVVR